MGDPTVKLVFAGNDAEAQRVMVALERKFENLENKLKHLNRTSKDTANSDPFGAMYSSAMKYVGQLVTVGATLNVVKRHLDDIAERQQKAFDTQKGVAGSLEGMAINIDVPLKAAEAEAQRISKQTGVELGRVMASIGTAFSAKGQLGAKDAFQAVETTAKLVPNLPEAQDLISGATLDIRKFAPELSSKQAQGFLMRAMVQARVTQLASMAEHGAPAITGMAMLDRANPQALTESAAIYGAITQGMRDPHGRKSRTAGTALLIQAREFLGDAADDMSNEQVLQTIAKDRGAFSAFFDGGQYKGKKRKGLQMTITGPNGEEMSVAADRASFERQAVPVLKSMLTPGSQEYGNWQSARQAMGDIATTEQDWQRKKAELDASQIKQVIDLSNKRQAAIASTRIEARSDAAWASARKDLEEGMQAAGFEWIDRFAAARRMNLEYWRGTDSQQAMQRTAQMMQHSLEYERSDSAATGYRTEEKTQMMIDKLQELIDITKNNGDEQKKKPIAPQGQRE